PRLQRSATLPPPGRGGTHEIKHDGSRILAGRGPAGVQLITRNGNDFTRRFPFIEMAVKSLPVRSCLIDGEAIVCDKDGLAVFELIRGHRTVASAVHCAFYLLELDGKDPDRNPKDCACQGAQGLAPEHRPQREFRGGRRGRLPRSVSAWLRGCRLKAAWRPIVLAGPRIG